MLADGIEAKCIALRELWAFIAAVVAGIIS